MTRAPDTPPPVEPRWRDTEVADRLGVSVVWLRREILDQTPGSCLRAGRSRMLTARHIRIVEALLEERACGKTAKESTSCPSRSTAARPASGTSAARTRGASWIKALEHAQKR